MLYSRFLKLSNAVVLTALVLTGCGSGDESDLSSTEDVQGISPAPSNTQPDFDKEKFAVAHRALMENDGDELAAQVELIEGRIDTDSEKRVYEKLETYSEILFILDQMEITKAIGEKSLSKAADFEEKTKRVGITRENAEPNFAFNFQLIDAAKQGHVLAGIKEDAWPNSPFDVERIAIHKLHLELLRKYKIDTYETSIAYWFEYEPTRSDLKQSLRTMQLVVSELIHKSE